jgi:hypothetical protein
MCHDLRVTQRSDDVAARVAPPDASTGPDAPRPPSPRVILPGPFLIPDLSPDRQFATVI